MSVINYLTKEGYDRLKAELDEMKTKGRDEVAKAIAEAREKGDLSENAEYDAAKDAQGMLELKINEMETQAPVTMEPAQVAHYSYLREHIAMFKRNPKEYKVPYIPDMPDGQPIGTTAEMGCGH